MMEIWDFSASFYHFLSYSALLTIPFAFGSHFFLLWRFSYSFCVRVSRIDTFFFAISFSMSRIDGHFFSVIFTQICISNSKSNENNPFSLRSHQFVRDYRKSGRHSIISASEKSVCMVWKFKISRCKHWPHCIFCRIPKMWMEGTTTTMATTS